jgi:hypothetical protein
MPWSRVAVSPDAWLPPRYLARRQQTPSLTFRDHLRAIGGAIEE